ncbi:hypothetical protein BDF19DRAFT_419618 [Syncephalis fuscata]|nr:hypothetical protein BDF19DRAFT_419618 [Syncephalis fuscata]
MKSLLIAAILLASFAYSAVAQTQKIASQTFIAPAPQPKDSAIIQNAYMIELHTEPGSPGVTVEQEELRKSIRLLNIPFNERGALTVALNSISIEVDDGDMEQIKN